MRRILIDTNAYVSFKANETNTVSMFQKVDYIGIDITVLAELLAGFKRGRKEKSNRADLEAFINTPRVEIINHDLYTAEFYAKIYLDLKKKGKPIPTNDIWIAAVAMQHSLALVSYDKHFSAVEGLVLRKE